ncbi:hypothetical protein [Thiomicrorhabdus aquaedulcis]|uniref:hypothetical protein n=1 Tax=Thiomicrorhabdus aquaedulcis TaxID=2211106 RepID=UPI000FD8F0E0|nr:hypothetical protein [Thiomicrorhabdus aquaedulcis]
MKNIEHLAVMVRGKNVALVGNSKNVLGKQFPVDEHDLVIRMNGAWNLPENMRLSVGQRLDILCVSGAKKEINALVEKLSNVVYMSPKNRNVISDTISKNLYFYPEEWWASLYEQLGSRPSTGCMAVDMLRRMIGDGTLTLYGFDFFENPSWHKQYSIKERIQVWLGKEIYVNPHDGVKEAMFIQNCLPTHQLTVIKTN